LLGFFFFLINILLITLTRGKAKRRGFGSFLVHWCDNKAGKLEIGTGPV